MVHAVQIGKFHKGGRIWTTGDITAGVKSWEAVAVADVIARGYDSRLKSRPFNNKHLIMY